MEENQNLVNLFNALSSKGVTTAQNIGEFKTLLDDEKNREELWKGLQAKGVFNGDYNEFQSNLGLTPISRLDVSDVEAQQQPNVPTVTMEQVDNEPQQPYGDLTAENFVTMQQRGKELADQRKRIQRELDNDTEMEPLTASQRKEYESQLRGLDEEMRGVSSWIDEWNKTEGA